MGFKEDYWREKMERQEASEGRMKTNFTKCTTWLSEFLHSDLLPGSKFIRILHKRSKEVRALRKLKHAHKMWSCYGK
jgi:hypothetical protein